MLPFDVTVDGTRRAVRAHLHGFWDIATTQAYLGQLRIAARQVAQRGARSWWLIDLSDATIQSRDVAELMGGELPTIIPASASLAVITGGSLQAMQAKRVVADDTHQYFSTPAAAEAWLDDQGRPA